MKFLPFLSCFHRPKVLPLIPQLTYLSMPSTYASYTIKETHQ
uniref:Uncharacterized protein n=1 Tax=Rhizophora mucronata TaxID=61149 RepID=A0A2P2QZZ7_RHIMU